MKTPTIPLARILPALLPFALFLLTTSARAAILLTFSQRGNDVVITLSGSTTIAHVVTTSTSSPINNFGPSGIHYIPTSQYGYTAKLYNDTGFPTAFGTFHSSSTASPFGVVDRAIAFGPGLSQGSLWAPTGELIIKNHTYLTLYGTNTPTGPIAHWLPDVVAFSSTFVPVPEPSTALLSALSAGVLVRRRRLA